MIKGKQKGYPVVKINDDMYYEAKSRAEEIPSDIRNSILEGEGRLTGTIGEVAVQQYLGGVKNPSSKPWHFDILLDGSLIEVKTKRRTVEPRSHYDCSVCAANHKQKCDYYVFTSVLDDMSKVWILGYLSREEFHKAAIFRKEGEHDPSNDQYCSWDCWNVKVGQLHDIKQLKDDMLVKKG